MYTRFTMAEVRIPKNLVLKMKGSSGGITPELDRIRTEYVIEVDFDGKESVRLRHGDSDFLEIAVDTLEKHHGFQTDYKEVQASIIQQQVEWKVTESSAWKMENLLNKELETLEKTCKVEKEYHKNFKERFPKEISILCSISDFGLVNKSLKELQERCESIRLTSKTVEKRNENRARRFCREKRWSGAFCYFEENTGELNIYSLNKKQSDKVFEDWESYQTETQHRENVQSKDSKFTDEKSNDSSQRRKSQNEAEAVTGSAGQKMAKADNNSLTHNEMKKPAKSDHFSMPKKDGKEAGYNSPLIKDKKPCQKDKEDDSLTQKSSVDLLQQGKDSRNQDWDSSEVSDGASASFPDRIPGQKSKDGKYEFSCGTIKVFVYQESVTELKGMDAVTNAANEKLMHGGGVAYFISKAAGKKMCAECSDYVQKNGAVKVTENYVSKGGDMKCKGIIHAVGPKWYEYRGRRTECAKDVYLTIFNCLKVSEERKWKKIALIAISSGIFGVPKQLCAEMYVKALVEFGILHSVSIKEVHFIDLNQDILDMIEKAHKDWVQNPGSISFDNALSYEEAPLYTGKKTKNKGDKELVSNNNVGYLGVEEPALVHFVRKEQGISLFRVASRLDLYVYSGSVLELQNVDAVVCSMDVNYEGVLLKRIAEVAGKEFVNKLQRRQKEHKRCEDGEVCVFPGGNMRVKYIIALVIDRYIKGASSSELDRLHGYFTKIIEEAEDIKVARVALPMIGCGYVKDQRDLQSCCIQLIKTITLLCADSVRNRQTTNVKEIHLVNYDENFTKYLLQNLQDVEKGHSDINRPFPVENYDQRYDALNLHGWTLHKPLKDISVKPPINEAKEPKVTVASMQKTLPKTLSQNCHYFESCKNMAVEELACEHAFCEKCVINMKKGCRVCMAEGKEGTNSQKIKPDASVIDEKCPVCFEALQNLKTLPCEHKLCESCLSQLHAPKCPTCFHIFGIITGNQPDGQMYYRTVTDSLPGYQSYGTIEIAYVFPDGIQKENHPEPGHPYKGTQRIAFLPDSPEGQKVLHLLRRSFDRRLTFTVGMSRTSGKENCVTYNDIHHKTRKDGGTERYGYPDPLYLQRVQEELKAKGVVE